MSDMTAPLTGRRALVTGGSRGIGAEVAADGGTAVALHADSADPDQVAASVDEAVSALGGLDILVNNAGVAYIADAETFPLEQFDRLVAINVRAVFVAIQRALPHFGEGSRIINIGSINADRVSVSGLSVYAMTKGAIAGLTRGLARELGAQGITVNNVQPGPVATDLNPEEGEFADANRQVTALRRYGQPRDIASAVSYLAGPEAGYITGANWNVDGGYTV